MTVPELYAESELPAAELAGRDDIVILGPSLGTNTHLWDEVAPALEGKTVVRFDLPGHGKSPATDEPFTLRELADAVIAVADARGIQSFDYAGVSVSGATALELALHYPERIKHAAVVCSGPKLGEQSVWLERAEAVRSGGTAQLLEASRGRWFAPAFLEQQASKADEVLQSIVDADDYSYARLCEAIGAFDIREDLPKINADVLVISGELDPAAPPAAGALIAEKVPGATQHVIAGIAHQATIENPAEVARVLNDFFAR